PQSPSRWRAMDSSGKPKNRRSAPPVFDSSDNHHPSRIEQIHSGHLLQEEINRRRQSPYGLVSGYRIGGSPIVIFALSTGMRSKELRLCNRDDLDDSGDVWEAIVLHPKGEGKYGWNRPVWVDPRCYPFMRRYLKAREVYLVKSNSYTDALFPGGRSDGGYMAGNTARTDKDIVEDEIGYHFDLRACRRTYGQNLIDSGVPVNQVSKILGHNNTATTEGYYCSLDDRDALDQISRHISNIGNDVA
ncbi:MAG: site-specific integrase, partial [Candidatus Methanomethylophilaceae archaeon]|nr:site-specific integrase [Candidatus Methanomethylophilaceae archaeon]